MEEISIYYNYRQKRPGHQELMCIISMAGGGYGRGEGVPAMEAGERCGFESVSCQMNLGLG